MEALEECQDDHENRLRCLESTMTSCQARNGLIGGGVWKMLELLIAAALASISTYFATSTK